MLTAEGWDFKGGGPIELSIPARATDLLAEDDTDEIPLPLARTLFARARGLTVGGAISEKEFHSFFGICMASVLESDITDGGRESTGVAVKIEELRRRDTLDGWAGLLPTVPLIPFFLLSYMERRGKTRHVDIRKEKKNELKLLLVRI